MTEALTENGEAHDKEIYGVKIPTLPPSELPIAHPDLENLPYPTDYSWNKALLTAEQLVSGAAGQNIHVVESSPKIPADLSASLHSFAKSQNIALWLAPNSIVSNLGPLPDIFKAAESTPNGYVNIEIDENVFGEDVLSQIEGMGDKYGEQNIGDGKVVIIDCSSPNVAKFMSVGHLRSTVIGESLSRIYRAGGYEVVRDNHLGDWGTQFGMLGRAKELWGEEIDKQMPDADSVQKLYTLYVMINEEVRREKAEDLTRLQTLHPDVDVKELSKQTQSVLENEGREWFRRLETGDPDARALLQEATSQSLQEFKRIYDLLGTSYEYYLGESFYESMLPNVIEAFEASGTATRDETNALSINFPESSHLPKLVLQKSDGTSLYQTREMATFIARQAWFNPDKILYVVGGDQVDYFRQTFAAFDQFTKGEGPSLEHVSFGMMSLPEGKMSTRKGNVVFLEDVLTAAMDKAREKIDSSGRALSEDEKTQIAKQVGVGSVIYMDLKQPRRRNIKFNLDEAISFDGNSAPYIQYAHTRASSILRSGEEEHKIPDPNITIEFSNQTEIDLIKLLAKYPTSIEKAIAENEPSVVADYVYQVADLFNKFYRNPILGDRDLRTRNTKLRITKASAQVIKNGLRLLGIEVPEKM